MRSLFLIIFLSITTLAFNARAEDTDFEKSSGKPENKKVQKVIAVLKMLDMDHPYLTETAEYVGDNTKDGYFYLTNQEIGSTGMKVQLRYDTGGFDKENLQLNLTEEGANYNITGSSEGVMYRYRLEF